MNSVKNLFVVVLLMGVSYGAFKVINSPDPNLSDNETGIESLDIQIGPRTDDPAGLNAGSLAGNAGQPQEFPPMPPNTFQNQGPMAAAGSGHDPSSSLTVPELKMPALDVLPFQSQADPVALSPESTRDNNSFIAPPPIASRNDANSAQPIPNQFLAQNTGQFDPTPQTALEPVTPRPAEMSRSDDNQFMAQASGVSRPPNPQHQSQPVNPAREASDLLSQGQNWNNNGGLANEMNSGAGSAMNGTTNPGHGFISNGQTAPTNASAHPPTNIDWSGINSLANSGNPRDALKNLSAYYAAPLPQDQQMQMLEWLDILAGKVIYSTEHHLEPRPYVVTGNDTLESLAATWNVPAQLIFNINREKIANPSMLIPGTELKVIQGPFNAVVNVQNQQLTLFLHGMYAGRFDIELGRDGGGITHGNFTVQQKLNGRDYVNQSGQTIAAGTTGNPYGNYWIGLDGQLAIHEANMASAQSDHRGSIKVASRDAADLFGILSNGSQVTVSR